MSAHSERHPYAIEMDFFHEIVYLEYSNTVFVRIYQMAYTKFGLTSFWH